MPDTPDNRHEFEPPADGSELLPYVTVTAVADASTGRLLEAAVGGQPRTAAPTVLLIPHDVPITTVWGHHSGNELVWCVDPTADLPVDQQLGDGTYMSTLKLDQRSAPVRVIDDVVHNGDEYEPIRLVTTLAEPSRAPAVEIVKHYTRHWPTAATMDSIKQAEPGEAFFRSQTSSAIYQEAWALLCVYQATIDTLRRSSDWH